MDVIEECRQLAQIKQALKKLEKKIDAFLKQLEKPR